MDPMALLTKEKTDALLKRIARDLADNKIVGSNAAIAYAIQSAIKIAWISGFEEGRKHPINQT